LAYILLYKRTHSDQTSYQTGVSYSFLNMISWNVPVFDDNVYYIWGVAWRCRSLSVDALHAW